MLSPARITGDTLLGPVALTGCHLLMSGRDRPASMGFWEYPAFVILGLAVGTYGTIVGLGGGFIIVPVMLLVVQASPQEAAGTSLLIIFFNSVSASFSYIRQKRVDLRSGTKFALATVPGAIIGAQTSTILTEGVFRLIFGLLLLGVSAFMLFKRDAPPRQELQPGAVEKRGRVTRRLTDERGDTWVYSFDERAGIALSFLAGFLSSVLGIGGGIIHVPALIHLFSFPAHIATATSQFILIISTAVGAGSHLWLQHVLILPAIAIGAGAILGAQIGASLSRRIHGGIIVRLLSLALLATGIRLVLSSMGI